MSLTPMTKLTFGTRFESAPALELAPMVSKKSQKKQQRIVDQGERAFAQAAHIKELEKQLAELPNINEATHRSFVIERADEPNADHPEHQQPQRQKLRQEEAHWDVVRTGQKPRETVGESRASSECKPQAHAPQMSRNARHARDIAAKDDSGVADQRKGKHRCECVNGDEYRTLERHRAPK